MTDPAQTPNPPKQDPLAVLEDLLNTTQNDAAKAKAAEAQAAAQNAQIAQLGAEHQAQDQQALQQQIAELAAIKDTPEYQARVQQDTAQTQANQQQSTAQQGYEIKQLGHTKI